MQWKHIITAKHQSNESQRRLYHIDFSALGPFPIVILLLSLLYLLIMCRTVSTDRLTAFLAQIGQILS